MKIKNCKFGKFNLKNDVIYDARNVICNKNHKKFWRYRAISAILRPELFELKIVKSSRFFWRFRQIWRYCFSLVMTVHEHFSICHIIYIISLSNVATWLPYMVFGFLGILQVISVFWIPETLGVPMLTTLEEAEQFYEDGLAKKSKK